MSGSKMKFRNLDISGYDFTDLEVDLLVIINCNVTGSEFGRAEIREAIFKNSDFRGCGFVGCKIKRPIISGCKESGTFLSDLLKIEKSKEVSF